MNNFLKYILTLALFLLTLLCPAQKTDSLLTLLKTSNEDTSRVNYYNLISIAYWQTASYTKAFVYADSALNLSRKLNNWQKGMAVAYDNRGTVNWYQGNYPAALKNYFSSLKIRDALNITQDKAVSYNNIAMVYLYQGNLSEALNFYNQALSIFKNECGGNSKNKKCLKYLAVSYNNIGNTYYSMQKPEEALNSFLAALKIREEIGDLQDLAASYNNIGILYEENGKFGEALTYYSKALKIMEKKNDKESIAGCYINIGTFFLRINKLHDARNNLEKAYQTAIEIGSKYELKEYYYSMAQLDSTTQNYKGAFENHKLFILYSDSLINEETKKKSLQESMQYEFDKKEIAAKAEQEKLDAISAEEKQKQTIVIYSVAGVLILVLVFSFSLFNRFRVTQKQKRVIEEQKVLVDTAYESLHEKNKEVMDSINYASRIQRALLPSESYIGNQFKKLLKN